MTDRNSQTRTGSAGYASPPLAVSVRSDEPSDLVIEVRGELDLFTGPMLRQHLEDSNGNGRHPGRIVYLARDLEFMDACGLRALLTAVDGHGSETITIREPSPMVRRLLDVVGLASMIEEPVDR